MADDNDASKKARKRRDWIVIIVSIAIAAVLIYLGSMDPDERYKLIGL